MTDKDLNYDNQMRVTRQETEIKRLTTRVAELETALEVTYTAMQKVRDDIPEMAYAAIITLVPEWVDAWDLIQKAGTS